MCLADMVKVVVDARPVYDYLAKGVCQDESCIVVQRVRVILLIYEATQQAIRPAARSVPDGDIWVVLQQILAQI